MTIILKLCTVAFTETQASTRKGRIGSLASASATTKIQRGLALA